MYCYKYMIHAMREYTDKRTGIVYTNAATLQTPTNAQVVEPHLDAFISDSFLKQYFGKGK